MNLYVEPMDCVVVDVDAEGRVRYQGEEEAWSVPTLQEKRAIIYAARKEMDALTEMVELLAASG